MTWLVTGGAGYIGAHVVRAFADEGLEAVVVDDLSSGHRGFVPDDVPFVEGTILDTGAARPTPCASTTSTGVVHVAGFKYAGVSVERPLHTYEQNVTGTVSLLRGDGGGRRRQDRVLLQRGHLRHARRGPGHRADPDAARSRRTARAS